ncbi:MAG TPA: FAD:protein FMN transferase [Acidimicrobiia bacterium]|nr:FAD:protein FMN transferase [Acidimicrobiia bacterium]
MRAERRFAAMGSSAHVVVRGDADLVDRAVARVGELEARWSRFLPASEISALNRAGRRPVVVSSDTVRLVQHCVHAWRATRGLFDPTVHDAMVANGYDRDLAEIEPGAATLSTRSPGLAGAVVDESSNLVWLPNGVRIDPGGLGKGLAADIVSAGLIDAGASGVMVNLGGDIRVRADAPRGEPWSINLEDPFDPTASLGGLALHDGAVATSSRLRRRWKQCCEDRHHVVDPRTGRPTRNPTVAVTAVAPSAWWAEVQATRALVAPEPFAAAGDVSLVVTDESGRVRATDDLEEVLRCSAH